MITEKRPSKALQNPYQSVFIEILNLKSRDILVKYYKFKSLGHS